MAVLSLGNVACRDDDDDNGDHGATGVGFGAPVGGPASNFNATVVDSGATVENLWIAVKRFIANGGDGRDAGGYAGVVTQNNNTSGYIKPVKKFPARKNLHWES